MLKRHGVLVFGNFKLKTAISDQRVLELIKQQISGEKGNCNIIPVKGNLYETRLFLPVLGVCEIFQLTQVVVSTQTAAISLELYHRVVISVD